MTRLLDNIGRESVIVITVIFFGIGALLSLCGGISMLAFGSTITALMAEDGLFFEEFEREFARELEELDADERAELERAGELGRGMFALMNTILAVVGVVMLIITPVQAAAAWGLYQRKPWSRPLTIIAGVIALVSSVLTLGSLVSIVSLVISVVIIIAFATDDGLKAMLSDARPDSPISDAGTF